MSAKLIVALDVDTFGEAKKLIDKLYPSVKIFKVGSQLFTGCGPKVVTYINKKGARVFLDLKFHDIPNTVANAVALSARLGVFMLTVHAQGGVEMLKSAKDAAVKAAKQAKSRRPLIVAVTVLTSQKFENLHQRVLDLADDAYTAGVDGVVASVQEAADIRRIFKKNFVIVTPGIRPQGAQAGDQKRVATPAVAITAGSDFLVVGRPIVEAKDPSAAVKEILKEMR
jgi:orotidine-5'-phosphate decarboxylase